MRRRAWVQIAVATLSGNSLRQIAHTHCPFVHRAAKLVAALLRVAGVTASLPPGLWLTSPAGWLPRTGISSGTLRSVIEYGTMGNLFLPQASAFLCYALRCEYCMYTHARSITLSEAADILETQLGYDRGKAEHFVKQFDRNNDGRLCATELDNFKTTVRDT